MSQNFRVGFKDGTSKLVVADNAEDAERKAIAERRAEGHAPIRTMTAPATPEARLAFIRASQAARSDQPLGFDASSYDWSDFLEGREAEHRDAELAELIAAQVDVPEMDERELYLGWLRKPTQGRSPDDARRDREHAEIKRQRRDFELRYFTGHGLEGR